MNNPRASRLPTKPRSTSEVSVRKVLEPYKSSVIQGGGLIRGGVTDVDEQEPRPLRPQQVAISERSDRRRAGRASRRQVYLALATAPISRAISAWMRALLSMLMWETLESSATSTLDSLPRKPGTAESGAPQPADW